MAQLHQVVGGLLRDIAKARFGSDLYSRSIARYYESLSLLRQFPVPRTEIDEVELDLKFTIDGMTEEPVQNETREATFAIVLERANEAIAQTIMDSIRVTATRLIADNQRKISPLGVLVKLRQHILGCLSQNSNTWVDSKGVLDVDAASRGIRLAVEQLLEKVFPGQKQDFSNQLNHVFTETEGNEVSAQLKKLSDTISELWRQESQSRIDIVVDRDKMIQMNHEMVCSIKVKTHVRNYVWVDVDPKDDVDEPWRRLTHE